MKHVPPFGSSDLAAPYIDGNPQFGIPASCVPAEVFNALQAEIINTIIAAKLTPDRDNLTQLQEAIGKMITDRDVAVNLATTEQAGIVELATTDEATAGTDTERAVTPKGVAAALAKYKKDNPIPAAPGNATATVAGLIELATNAEAQAGTDAARAITPATLHAAFVASKAANGYVKLPGDMILQWGNTTAAANSVTLPIAFPNAGLCAGLTVKTNSYSGITGVSKTAITLITTTGACWWWAFGY